MFPKYPGFRFTDIKNACLPLSLDCELWEGRDCDLFSFVPSVSSTLPGTQGASDTFVELN